MRKILNFALKIKGGGREGGACEVLRPCHPPKIWNVHQLNSRNRTGLGGRQRSRRATEEQEGDRGAGEREQPRRA